MAKHTIENSETVVRWRLTQMENQVGLVAEVAGVEYPQLVARIGNDGIQLLALTREAYSWFAVRDGRILIAPPSC